MTATIDEINASDWGTIANTVLSSSKPLVLRGIVAHWPMVQASNKGINEAIQYLDGFYNDHPIMLFQGNDLVDGRFFYTDDFSDFNFSKKQGNLRDVLQLISDEIRTPSDNTYYVGSASVDTWLPGFANENNLAIPNQNPLTSFWLGNQSTVSAHYDFPDNIACNVTGRRRFTILPPEQLANLYVGPLHFTPAGQAISSVNLSKPDVDKYPKIQQALDSAYVAELEPGDGVFIPSMWWHQVEALDDFNILINYWWRSTPEYFGAPSNVLQHALLALRNLPKDQRKAWKNLFDYYIFEHEEQDLSHIPSDGLGSLGEIDQAMARQLRADLLNKLNR